MLVTVLRDGASTQARARLAAAPGPRSVALVDNAFRGPFARVRPRKGSSPGRPLRYRCRRTAAYKRPPRRGAPRFGGDREATGALHRPGRVRHDLRRAGRPRPGVDHDQAREATPRPGQPRARHAQPAQAHRRYLPGAGEPRPLPRDGPSRLFQSQLVQRRVVLSAPDPLRLLHVGLQDAGRPARTSPGVTTPAARPRPCSRPGCTARRIAPSSSTSACAGSAWAVPRAPTRASPTSSSPPSTAGPAPSFRGRRAERAGERARRPQGPPRPLRFSGPSHGLG